MFAINAVCDVTYLPRFRRCWLMTGCPVAAMCPRCCPHPMTCRWRFSFSFCGRFRWFLAENKQWQITKIISVPKTLRMKSLILQKVRLLNEISPKSAATPENEEKRIFSGETRIIWFLSNIRNNSTYFQWRHAWENCARHDFDGKSVIAFQGWQQQILNVRLRSRYSLRPRKPHELVTSAVVGAGTRISGVGNLNFAVPTPTAGSLRAPAPEQLGAWNWKTFAQLACPAIHICWTGNQITGSPLRHPDFFGSGCPKLLGAPAPQPCLRRSW